MITSPIAGLRAAGALLGLAAIGAYLAIALARLSYPFTVEVLESNSLIEVHRILAGQSLYAPPASATCRTATRRCTSGSRRR